MSQNIILLGASYSAVPAVTLPKTGGGTATFTDVTDTTAAAADVASGKYFYTSAGVRTQGTSSGGGGGGIQVGYADAEPSSASSSISFTGLSGEPTSFAIVASSELATGASPYKTAMVVFDGTNVIGQKITNTSNAQVTYDSTGFSKSYSNGTLTVTGTGTNFQPIEYLFTYTYGGTSGNIQKKDVQVGSGATSITFTDLEDEPLYWSLIFKSDFGTSSGYQRVIGIMKDSYGTYGLSMDSSAKYSVDNYSASYSNGSLVISTSGTNAGGYFHQPGYYQLTYAVDPDALNLQEKTGIGATTSSQTITADSGYDGLESVQINPVSQTNLTAANIKSGTTISISNGSTNLWSVTGTYSGGGGGGMNVQAYIGMDTLAVNTYTATDLTLKVAKTGKYTVSWDGCRSSTSGTNGSRLYINSTAQTAYTTFDSTNTRFQHVEMKNVSLSANDTITVYCRARSTSYYMSVSNLVIVQTA